MMPDEVDLTILRYLETSPQTLTPLFARVPRSTVYHRIRKLIEGGLVVRRDKKAVLSQHGRRALEEARESSTPVRREPDIVEFVPHLALAPTAVHRALLTLIAAAVVARRHRLSGSHHPTFLLVGAKLTWKTFMGRLSCHMVGIDPTKYVLQMTAETPGSLIQRRGATGQVVTKRDAISQPVVCLDELGRATADVLRIAKLLFSGEIETPFENDTLEILAVPIATMNPKVDHDGADITEIVGLDEGIARRSIIANLTGVGIPAEILTEGDARLDQARSRGAAEFPAPRHPGWVPSTEIQHILQDAFEFPERLADVDCTMVAQLCTALTAWLSRDDALFLGVRSYLVILETLGWLKEDWPRALPALDRGERTPEPTDPPSESPAAPQSLDPLDYNAKVRFILSALKALGLGPEEGADLMACVQKLGLERLTELELLDCMLSSMGIGLGDVKRILAASKRLAEATGRPAAKAATVMLELIRAILDAFPKELAQNELHRSVLAMISASADVGRLEERVRIMTTETRGIESSRAALARRQADEKARLRDLEARRKRAEVELAETEDRLAESEYELQRIQGMCKEQADDIERAKDHLRLLSGELHPHGPFAIELGHALKARRQGRAKARIVGLSPSSLIELFNLYVSKIAPHLVPNWKIKELHRVICRELARKLRAELAETKRILEDPEKSVSEQLRAVDDACRHLRWREIIPAP